MSRSSPTLATLDGSPVRPAPPQRRARPWHPRAGLTLPELLICVGVAAAFVAVVLPTVQRLRQGARDVVCQARLRALALGAESFRARHKSYAGYAVAVSAPDPPRPPEPSPYRPPGEPMPLKPDSPGPAGADEPEPHHVELGLLNQLAPYVGFRQVAAATPAVDLPADVQSPDVEAAGDARDGPVSAYYTGFVYAPGLAGLPTSPATAHRLLLLRPGRVPVRTGSSEPSVLWADAVLATNPGAGTEAWQFAHPRPGADAAAGGLAYRSGGDCRGQHRVYSDGSVEWVSGPSLGLKGMTPSAAERSATVRADGKFWWF